MESILNSAQSIGKTNVNGQLEVLIEPASAPGGCRLANRQADSATGDSDRRLIAEARATYYCTKTRSKNIAVVEEKAASHANPLSANSSNYRILRSFICRYEHSSNNSMKRYSVDELERGILSGNRRLLSKAISLIESTRTDDFALGQELIERLLPRTGTAQRIGITGVPGVGKSTFIEAFGLMLIGRGHSTAVLAVDPSSVRSGGSILGDKTRMQALAQHEKAFIRPSPSAGSLGGVARRTRETILLCEAAGFDVVIVETVGVGQSETAVATMVDFFLVLMLANAGDELQGIKRGIMEAADAVAVNKADGAFASAARAARRRLASALHLIAPKHSDWTVPVLTCSAVEQTGIDDVWSTIVAFFERTESVRQHRALQEREWLRELIRDELATLFSSNPAVAGMLPGFERDVVQGVRSPAAAAHTLINVFTSSLRDGAQKEP